MASLFCPGSTLPMMAPQVPIARPEVFALMRNGHEVLRGAMKDLSDALVLPNKEKADSKKAVALFAQQWADFMRWQTIHMRMEEGETGKAEGVFKMLDRLCGNASKNAGLDESHHAVEGLERAVARALWWQSFDGVRDAFSHFYTVNSEHLGHEEAVMMPMIKKLSDEGVNMRELMRKSVLPLISPADLAFYVSFAMRVLEKNPGGMPRARVFAQALQACADSVAEWEPQRKAIEGSVSPALYAQIDQEIALKKFGVDAYPRGHGPDVKPGLFG